MFVSQFENRLLIEPPQIHASLPPGITLVEAEGFKEWFMDIEVLDANPLYMNKVFRLKFCFSSTYPIGMQLDRSQLGRILLTSEIKNPPKSPLSNQQIHHDLFLFTLISTRMALYVWTSWGSKAGVLFKTSKVFA